MNDLDSEQMLSIRLESGVLSKPGTQAIIVDSVPMGKQDPEPTTDWLRLLCGFEDAKSSAAAQVLMNGGKKPKK